MDERTIAIRNKAGYISFHVFIALSFIQYLLDLFGVPTFDRYHSIGVTQQTLIAVFMTFFYLALNAIMGVPQMPDSDESTPRKKKALYIFLPIALVQLTMFFLLMRSDQLRNSSVSWLELFTIFIVASSFIGWCIFRSTAYIAKKTEERELRDFPED